MNKHDQALKAYAALLSAEIALKNAGQSAGNETYDLVRRAITGLHAEILRGAFLPALAEFPSAILNIGAAPSANIPGSFPLVWDSVRNAASLLGLHAELLAERTPEGGEKTFIARIQTTSGHPVTLADVAELSATLRQDCIAGQPHDLLGRPAGVGFLAGPHADAWGEFNAQYFLLP